MTTPTADRPPANPNPTAEIVAVWHTGPPDPAEYAAPVVVLLHGRGSDERDIIGLADLLPTGPRYVALRAPLAEGNGYAWFANRGIGRPVAESLAATTEWFITWLDRVAGPTRPVVLVGFSGGATFAGGVAIAHPDRFAGLATTYATLPFDAGVPVTPGRLEGLPVFLAHGSGDRVIPAELQARTWEYLQHESGAVLTARRSAGGHQLTRDDIEALGEWIDSVVDHRS
jgi:phospholipase/carboxylesterase